MLEQFGRRLRIGLVGGGMDSVIGRTHLVAMRVDGFYELVAGAMSVDPAIARRSGAAALLDAGRIYTDYRQMADAESRRPDGIDVVAIATPPQLHFDVAKTFLERGIDVICEKPVTASLAQAIDLAAVVREHDRLFCLTHCYTGYPMVRQARAMVAAGELGRLRLVEAELCAGDPGVSVEPADPAQRHWRFRADSMGKGAILGEVASHAHNIATFVTGLSITEVAAEMSTFVECREVFDNSYVTARFSNGARGRIWGSYVAAGNDHGLSFRVFGEKGGLTWVQEDPEVLWFKPIGRPAVRLARGYDSLSREAEEATRFRPGHPEGYALAFANLYSDFARAIIARRLGHPHQHYVSTLPGIDDGIEVMALIEAAMASQQDGGTWKPVACSTP
ncbi:Gfo/Idh/MocA family protein [Mesorhizobium sp. ES1-6]|uniref:Gfo/Idh/MocA family protein n=1 Tax=Mesorhizobium sp. ES1-6 TaxID=2876626 RepID=UPI001CCF5F1D|nr:Gfo/Idh/MocA family oxidoreductase [Mesorhizobium sp. ES1-6]MBZ9801118.1 Gfo/Idh/MocA family oxidoreductase [Mesorhizobium sp. ES1-6]